MKSASKVSGVCLSVLSSFVAAALFIGASALPARASIPGTATASATIQWSVLSSGWSMDQAVYSDDGGNYSSTGINPYSVTCTVNWGNAIKSRKATITYVQTFTWGGPPLLYNDLVYKHDVAASARFERAGQTAHALSKAQYAVGENTFSFPAEATGTAENSPTGDSATGGGKVTIEGRTSWSETGTLEADVTTP